MKGKGNRPARGGEVKRRVVRDSFGNARTQVEHTDWVSAADLLRNEPWDDDLTPFQQSIKHMMEQLPNAPEDSYGVKGTVTRRDLPQAS